MTTPNFSQEARRLLNNININFDDESKLTVIIYTLQRAYENGREEVCPHVNRDEIGGDCNACAEILKERIQQGKISYRKGLLRAITIAESSVPRHTECGNKIAGLIKEQAERDHE